VTTQAPSWSNSSSGRAAPGTVIGGRYALRTAIGNGGMGTVWRAADTVLRREVAVKEVVLPPALAASDRDAMYERTLREARAAASLSHPSVVQVFDVVTEGGRPWIVMEMLDARSLADMIIEDGPLNPRAVAKIGIALLGALEVAHAGGVLHRDVKPANVLITSDGRCVLTDFGVAKLPTDVQLTTPGMVLGSPHFISPERALGHRFGPPSDLFSLGVTLYTAVEGRPPFDKGDPLATMHAVVEDEPVPPIRCGPLEGVLYGLMEKDPARRWDVHACRTVLRELLAGPLTQQVSAQHVTDPWAVVTPQPQQATAWVTPAQNRPSGQIGGRAMLSTGENPATRSKRGGRSGGAALDEPTGAHGAPTGALSAINRRGAGANPAKTVLGQVRAWPRNVRLAAIGGLAAVLLIGGVSYAMIGGDQPEPPAGVAAPQTSASPSPPPPPPGRELLHLGYKVNVPEGWKEAKVQTYINVTDPADSGRWLRINVTKEKNPKAALEGAEKNLLSGSCIQGGLERVSLTEAPLAGVNGWRFEFKCQPKEGKPLRHGIWQISIVNGQACHVYLSTLDSTFAADKAVFDTAIASFAQA
jgi:eukaryotic-like serine/threonine-protein kinase